MAPDDILEQSGFAYVTLSLPCDPIGRLMVAMWIVSPADKKRSGADIPHAISDGGNGALSVGALRGNEAIRQTEEEHIVLWFEPQLGARSFCLFLAVSPQSVRRIGFAVRMRASAVADNDDLSSQSLSAGVGYQTAAGKALVVRVRRDNDKRPILELLTQGAEWKRTRRLDRRRSSPQILRAPGLGEDPRRRVCQRSIWAWLAEIGCKVTRYAFDRVRTKEGLKSD